MVQQIRVLFSFFLLFSIFFRNSTSVNTLSLSQSITLSLSQSIRDGETLVSTSGTFEAGFFSPGNSTSRYLGVWYTNLSPTTVVWVANRETPLNNAFGVLKFNEKGNLVILNGTNTTIWSSNTSIKEVNSPIAQLLDTGNLVVKTGHDYNEDNYLWQSFDYPCNVFLPGMKLGWNLEIGLERFVSSWKSNDDPAKGEYSMKIDIRGYPQVLMLKGSVTKFRLGSWNGISPTGYPTQQLKQNQRYEFVVNGKEVFHRYEVLDSSIISIYILTPLGVMQGLAWTSGERSGKVITTDGDDTCDHYGWCGAHSICNVDGNVPKCECLKGYVPKFPEQWKISYWSNGCVPRNRSNCQSSVIFWKYSNMKLPDTSLSWFDKTMNLEQCHKLCLKNCSCMAYANLDIRNGGSGCLLWFGELIDMRKFNQWGQDFYVRIPASELDHVTVNSQKYQKFVGIMVRVIIFGLLACVSMMMLRKRVRARVFNLSPFKWRRDQYFRLRMEGMDLPTFDLSTIRKATNNFSSSNKLGEGGFGPVYKGTLMDGQVVAIKRHSQVSDQGADEFKNEVMFISKLQHCNLVKLLGCCLQRGEKMLIYEYMPNKSLDYFIFDETRSKLLAWHKRFHIIGGIARGLLYLHQDSRLKIIHRDLKCSNILLDAHMNPKISDFGNARTFGGDQLQAKTKKVIGTYGYLPPEYAMHGHYSVKSDVFSFGVVILEIVSGKKNRGFSDPEHDHNLLGHAWRLWSENGPLELVDKHLREECIFSEVIRCIHVGLLCVQQKSKDRPDMSSVVLMLNGEKLLSPPKVPGFYTGNGLNESDSSSGKRYFSSTNEMSITVFEPR